MIIGRKRQQKIKCEKISYTLKEAKTELNLVKRIHKRYRLECRIYHCPQCNTFHLTSKNNEVGKIDVKIEHTEIWQQILKNQENEKYNDVPCNS